MSMLKDIAYNCRQATYLAEKKQFDGLTLKEHLQLKYHLTGCSVCRLYQKQSALITQALQKSYTDISFPNLSLEPSFKKQLQMQIDHVLNNR
jgi:hypothetical protein